MRKRLLATLVGLTAVATLVASCSDEQADAEEDSTDDVRAVLVSSGFDCSETEPDARVEDDVDFGVEVRSEYTCTKDEADIRALEFASTDAAESAVDDISTMACNVLGQPVSLVVTDAWVISEGEEAGSRALLTEAATALGVDPTMQSCETTDSSDPDGADPNGADPDGSSSESPASDTTTAPATDSNPEPAD